MVDWKNNPITEPSPDFPDSDGKPVYDEDTETIKYDAIGNPTKYLGASLSWNGRELTSYNVDDDTNTTADETLKVTYTYDADGLRGTKTVNGTKSTYHYVSGKLRYETRGNLKFYYFYDASGNLSAIRYYPANSIDGYMYYPLTNSRGDVVSIYNSSGTPVVTYEYDAWGNCTIVSDTSGRNIGELNPFRYRGYYYDSETKLYYLQSRYYDPEVGRFINADNLISDLGGDVLGNNMFAYCMNNPVNTSDPSGHWSKWATAGLIVGAALCIAAVSILTCGVGTATLAGAVAVGAAKGALIGAAAGTIVGGGIGYAATGTVEGMLEGAAIGFGVGAVVGAVVGGTSAYMSARTPTTNIYRSVSNAEFQDIKNTGKFNLSPGGMESKQFGFNLSETRQFGNMVGQNKIVSAKIPTNMLNRFYTGGVDTSIFRCGTLTIYSDELAMFNQIVSGTIKFIS